MCERGAEERNGGGAGLGERWASRVDGEDECGRGGSGDGLCEAMRCGGEWGDGVGSWHREDEGEGAEWRKEGVWDMRSIGGALCGLCA